MTATKTIPGHKISWFVYAGTGVDRVRIPRQASMRGQWGYDVTCSCGWESKTGGGVKRWVTELVEDHKCETRLAAEDPEYAALLARLVRCSS